MVTVCMSREGLDVGRKRFPHTILVFRRDKIPVITIPVITGKSTCPFDVIIFILFLSQCDILMPLQP